MTVSRVFLRSHLLLRASASCLRITHSAIPSINSSFSRRAFTSSTAVWEDIVQTPSRGPDIALTDDRAASTGSIANSIALLRISRRLAKGEIEELLRSKGFNIKRVQLRVDRFTFHNDNMCFVELGSLEEAQRAIKELDEVEVHHKKIKARPLKGNFRWGSIENPKQQPYGSRYFLDEGNAAEEALRPLVEERRMLLQVQTPGWSPGARVSEAKQNAIDIIGQNFGKYGIERISDTALFFGDKKEKPRMLGFIDFKTKEDADQAIQEKHDTEINGRLVWVSRAEPAAWRLQQFSKSVPKLVEDMQEKGLWSKEMYEDKFLNPLQKNTH